MIAIARCGSWIGKALLLFFALAFAGQMRAQQPSRREMHLHRRRRQRQRQPRSCNSTLTSWNQRWRSSGNR